MDRAVAVGVHVRIDAGAAERHEDGCRAPRRRSRLPGRGWAGLPSADFRRFLSFGEVRLQDRAGERGRCNDAVKKQLGVADR